MTTISDEYRAELRQLAKDIARHRIRAALDRVAIMEELPYVHFTRQEDELVADIVEAHLIAILNFLETYPI